MRRPQIPWNSNDDKPLTKGEADGQYIPKPTDAADKQILTYNYATRKWEAKDAQGIDKSGYADGQVPVYNAANDDFEPGDGGKIYQPGTGIAIANPDTRTPTISSTLGSIALSGRKEDYAHLPTGLGTADAGKAYLVDADGLIYIWDGSAWPAQGGGVDAGLSNQQAKSWRLLITKGNAPLVSGAFVAIEEMELYAVSGGANLCTGGTPFASSSFSSGFVAAVAFDGDKTQSTTPNDCWASEDTAASWNSPHFLGYVLGAASNVNAFKIWNRVNQNQAPPRDFILQSSYESTDGFNGKWVDEIVVTDQTGWSAGEAREFIR